MDDQEYERSYVNKQSADISNSTVRDIHQTTNGLLPFVTIIAIVVIGLVVLAVVVASPNNPSTPSSSGQVLPLQTTTPSPSLTATITPTSVPRISLTVYRRTDSTIQVTTGDEITIEANGFIKVGDFVGSVDPNGRTAGMLGASLESYNLQPNFPHGGLMCKVKGESQWRFCGTSLTFTAPFSGILEFEVNDNDQANNSGQYDVTVQIR